MTLPNSKTLNWIKKAQSQTELIGKDALTWRKVAQKSGIELAPELGGIGRGLKKTQSKNLQQQSLLATSEMAEMATHGAISKYRFNQFFKKQTIPLEYYLLPACGAGLDAYYLLPHLRNIDTLVVSDLNPLAVWMCYENLKSSPSTQSKIWPICHDLNQLPLNLPQKSFAFLDPARRQSGQRLKSDYIPNLKTCIQFLEKFEAAQIKLSPNEDLIELRSTYPDWSWELIQHGSELKELCGHHGFQQAGIQVTHLNHEGEMIAQYRGDIKHELSYLAEVDISKHLVIPEPCLRQSELLQQWCEEYDVQASSFEHIYISDKPVPLAKSFDVLEQLPLKTSNIIKALKQHNRRVELRTLGLKPDQKLIKALNPFKKLASSEAPLVLLLAKANKQPKAFLLKQV